MHEALAVGVLLLIILILYFGSSGGGGNSGGGGGNMGVNPDDCGCGCNGANTQAMRAAALSGMDLSSQNQSNARFKRPQVKSTIKNAHHDMKFTTPRPAFKSGYTLKSAYHILH
jgi:hypothetical protein